MSPGPSSYPPLQVPQRPPRNPKTGKQSSTAQAPSILPRPTLEGRVHPFLLMGTLRHPGTVPCTTRRCTAPRHCPDRNGPQSSVAWGGGPRPPRSHTFPSHAPSQQGWVLLTSAARFCRPLVDGAKIWTQKPGLGGRGLRHLRPNPHRPAPPRSGKGGASRSFFCGVKVEPVVGLRQGWGLIWGRGSRGVGVQPGLRNSATVESGLGGQSGLGGLTRAGGLSRWGSASVGILRPEIGAQPGRGGGGNLAFHLKESPSVFQTLAPVCHPWAPTKGHKRGAGL